jgi:hypothetical protein
MTNTSQNLNPSYGYLWWLNGKSSYMVPGSQIVFPGSWAPEAPADMIAALGKNGQFINVIPSQRLVMVRMGEAPDTSYDVPMQFNNDIWRKLNDVIYNQTTVENNIATLRFELKQNYPNLFNPSTSISFSVGTYSYMSLRMYDVLGREIATIFSGTIPAGSYTKQWDASHLPSGVYFYHLKAGGYRETKKLVLIK